ncbi:hypothetical protein [Dermatobacter hominis]|uniref:hypothetical protein n=1 Tax=Dermatobacter hominis TaxID=2884263 RepID=UPI001D1041C6|nr:hypothetical protein [Dermatobacter hominis]UDY35095.1 hypothetical protein LH044_17360 [Dermatobacter hominis]
MSPLVLVVAVAAVTVGSRVAALALLPAPSGRTAEVIARLPAPLFAALAAVSITGAAGSPDPGVIGASLGALASTPRRSLLATLVAGLAGYAVGTWIAGR